MTAAPATAFSLPPGREAREPPEDRGLARDEVRLLVARPDQVIHHRFRNLPLHLDPGDAVVVNTSATRKAALDAKWRGHRVSVHLSGRQEQGRWLMEVRSGDARHPIFDVRPGDRLAFDHGGRGVVERPAIVGSRRLWIAALLLPLPVEQFLDAYGRPISYGYLEGRYPLETYQTVFARPDDPTGSSAEMPSAGRPVTPAVITALVSRGVTVAPITLHAGVSSLERHEPPPPEWFRVPAATAAAVSAARLHGHRVVAVGTSVTRALETAAGESGEVRPAQGWTHLVLGSDRPARVVNGLVTGWHPPEASHLLLLEAVAGVELVTSAYQEAVSSGYLWHEFGDSCLLLP